MLVLAYQIVWMPKKKNSFGIRNTQYSTALSVHKQPSVFNTTYTIQSRVNCSNKFETFSTKFMFLKKTLVFLCAHFPNFFFKLQTDWIDHIRNVSTLLFISLKLKLSQPFHFQGVKFKNLRAFWYSLSKIYKNAPQNPINSDQNKVYLNLYSCIHISILSY